MILFLKVGIVGMVTNSLTGWYAQFDKSDEPQMLCSFVDGKKNDLPIYGWEWSQKVPRGVSGYLKMDTWNGMSMPFKLRRKITSSINYMGSINFGTIPVRLNSTQSLLGENYWRP